MRHAQRTPFSAQPQAADAAAPAAESLTTTTLAAYPAAESLTTTTLAAYPEQRLAGLRTQATRERQRTVTRM
jgi:hypothetical protein